MIKLKNILKESKYAFDRKFGEPLPTLKDIAKKHQVKEETKEEIVTEAHQFTIKYKKKDGDDYYLKILSLRANDFKDAVRKGLSKLKSKEEKVIVSVSQDTKKDYSVD